MYFLTLGSPPAELAPSSSCVRVAPSIWGFGASISTLRSVVAGVKALALPLAQSLTCCLHHTARALWLAGSFGRRVVAVRWFRWICSGGVSSRPQGVAAMGTPQGFLCLALQTPCSLQPDFCPAVLVLIIAKESQSFLPLCLPCCLDVVRLPAYMAHLIYCACSDWGFGAWVLIIAEQSQPFLPPCLTLCLSIWLVQVARPGLRVFRVVAQ